MKLINIKNKIRKLLRLIKHKKDLRDSMDTILKQDMLENILSSQGITFLPKIEPNSLFSSITGISKLEQLEIKSDFSNGISPVNDYYFLCLLAKYLKIKTYFEIGTWVGLSALNISKTLNDNVEIFTLDIEPSHPDIKEFGIPQEIFGYYSHQKSNIKHLLGDSKHFDFSQFEKSIDLVFIDGNHSYEYVKNDTKISLNLLRNEKAVIVWHDYLLMGNINKNVLCGILETIPKEYHKHLVYLDQTNMALFSYSFNFNNNKQPKWSIPKNLFTIKFTS